MPGVSRSPVWVPVFLVTRRAQRLLVERRNYNDRSNVDWTIASGTDHGMRLPNQFRHSHCCIIQIQEPDTFLKRGGCFEVFIDLPLSDGVV